jgi:hypothetical protein
MPTTDRIDPDTLRASNHDLAALGDHTSTRPPRHRKGELFLKGPIPWIWLLLASRLPGKALQIALLLWKEAGCKNKRTVRFRLKSAAQMGMSIPTARRGLHALAAARLVSIQRLPGQSPKVTLLDATEDTPIQ